jgi:uroporphyrinogen-III synthase
MTNQPLRGKNIVVTRPAHQAEALASCIRTAGGDAILFPVIEIRDVEDPRALHAVIDRLHEFDLAVFISPNAVAKALTAIAARRALPPQLAVAAIGAGSVKALARFGVDQVIAPAGRFDSEALLELPQLAQPRGKRVVVFRGEGGRELLGDSLQARGALVEYAQCYHRMRSKSDPAPLIDAWQRNALSAVTVTSSEGLRHLFDLVGTVGHAPLLKTPLFAPHPRIAQAARELGLATVIATEPGDDGLVAGLIDYFRVSRVEGEGRSD